MASFQPHVIRHRVRGDIQLVCHLHFYARRVQVGGLLRVHRLGVWSAGLRRLGRIQLHHRKVFRHVAREGTHPRPLPVPKRGQDLKSAPLSRPLSGDFLPFLSPFNPCFPVKIAQVLCLRPCSYSE